MVDVYEKAKGVAEVGVNLATKGAGVAGGLIVGKFIGDTVEQIVTTPVTAASPLLDKFIAYISNNVPKGIGAYLLSLLKTGTDMVDNVIEGATYGLAGSVVVDTVARAQHKGVPTLILGEQKIQTLLRENAELKQAMQQAMQRISAGAPMVRVEEIAQPKRPLEQKYEFAQGEQIPGVVYEKRPLERQYQFVGKSVTSPEILASGFGFKVD